MRVTFAHFLRKAGKMIEMKVAGIAIDAVSRNPIVLLRDTLERRALPIWIGETEAKAIISALDGRPLERPMTHDLMLNFLDTWGITVERIVVHGLKNSTFYVNKFQKLRKALHNITHKFDITPPKQNKFTPPINEPDKPIIQALEPVQQLSSKQQYHDFVAQYRKTNGNMPYKKAQEEIKLKKLWKK